MKPTLLSAIAFAFPGSAALAATYVLHFKADPDSAAEVASLDLSAG